MFVCTMSANLCTGFSILLRLQVRHICRRAYIVRASMPVLVPFTQVWQTGGFPTHKPRSVLLLLQSTRSLKEQLPWIGGAFGTVWLDAIIFWQV